MKGYSIIVTGILVIVLFASIYDGRKRVNDMNELQAEKDLLQKQNEELEYRIDSLDSLVQTIPTDSAPKIITRIITRYEKDFEHIDTANADENFRIFTDWLSENDSTPQ